ncbi:hypothetical protein HK100_003949 [Physocladia obscura]|uniref:C3H1-type domain-containing protein n=1 Tax=Physocladia obscura TaxID=109957 RepID=A0AAD5T7B3_9FUNG|nr:hypothetical protein HK100_003949 [Physocladia obscura]
MTRSLPSEQNQQAIIDLVLVNPISVIVGATGSGKSSKIPQILQQHFKQPILCTQPRRIAAVSLAARVAAERGVAVGGTDVGFHIGQRNVSVTNTQILFSTAGILLKELLASGFANMPYKVICIDEVHERSVESDLVLASVKALLAAQRVCSIKLVIMSATLDIKAYCSYFALGPESVFRIPEYASLDAIPATREIYLDYLPASNNLSRLQKEFTLAHNLNLTAFVPMLQDVVVETVKYVHLKFAKPTDNNGSILVFLPTYRMLVEVDRMLRKLNLGIIVHCLHSSVDVENCLSTINGSADSKTSDRTVILTSNISESSLTFNNCAYVIDPSLTIQVKWKDSRYTPTLVWCSKSQSNQRRGRTGRTCPGTVFRLVPKKFFDKFVEFETPQLILSNLRNEALAFTCSPDTTLRNARKIFSQCPNPPSAQVVDDAFSFLESFGACHIKSGQRSHVSATSVGEFIAAFPFSFEATLLILNGTRLGILYESIVLAAIVSNTPHPIIKHVGENINGHQQKFGVSDDQTLLIGNLAAVDFFNLRYAVKKRLEKLPLSETLPFWHIPDDEAQFAREHYMIPDAIRNVVNQVDFAIGVLHKFRPTFLKDLYPAMFHASGHTLPDANNYSKFLYNNQHKWTLNYQMAKDHRLRALIDNMTQMNILQTDVFSPSSVPICRFGDTCKFGSNCRFRHISETETNRNIKIMFEWLYQSSTLPLEIQNRYIDDTRAEYFDIEFVKTRSEYRNSHFIMFGDGDFAFSEALARRTKYKVIGTVLDSFEGLVNVYGDNAVFRVERMESEYSAIVEFEVDATRMHEQKHDYWFQHTENSSVVLVWLFPYLGTGDNNEDNSKLITDFFKSARARFLSKTAINVRILLGLCNDQFSRWDVLARGRSECFMLMGSFQFDLDGFESYQPRMASQDSGFNLEISKTVYENLRHKKTSKTPEIFDNKIDAMQSQFRTLPVTSPSLTQSIDNKENLPKDQIASSEYESLPGEGKLITENPFKMFNFNSDSHFELTNDVQRIFGGFEKGWETRIVGIAGVYRSGKSYVMNQLVGSKTGFRLGHSTQAETQGIWAWGRRLPKSKSYIICLDTEGLGDVKKRNSDNDMRLYTLTILINKKGGINCSPSWLCDKTLAKTLLQNSDNGDQLKPINMREYLPKLLVLIRDAYLEIPGTPRQYLLEGCLGQDDNQKDIRAAITSQFPSIDCIAVPFSCDPTKFKHVEEMSNKQLNPLFVSVMRDFIAEFLANTPPKQYFGDIINGSYLLYCQQAIEMMNSRKQVGLGDLFKILIAHEANEAKLEAETLYKHEMDKATVLSGAIKMISEALIGQSRDLTVEEFRQHVEFADPDGGSEILMNEGLVGRYWSLNYSASKDAYAAHFKSIYTRISLKVEKFIWDENQDKITKDTENVMKILELNALQTEICLNKIKHEEEIRARELEEDYLKQQNEQNKIWMVLVKKLQDDLDKLKHEADVKDKQFKDAIIQATKDNDIKLEKMLYEKFQTLQNNVRIPPPPPQYFMPPFNFSSLSGYYKDNAYNRRIGRVGMPMGSCVVSKR